MSELKKYTGGCHCGKVAYEVSANLDNVISCNCSICQKRGLLLTFVPPEQFVLQKGDEKALTDYQFNKKVIHHMFCPECGVESFATGTARRTARGCTPSTCDAWRTWTSPPSSPNRLTAGASNSSGMMSATPSSSVAGWMA